MNKKYLPYLIFMAKVILLLLLGYYIFYIRKNDTISTYQAWISLNPFNGLNTLLLIFSFLLMPLNWYLEACKFKILFKGKKQYSHFKFIKIIFGGIVFALITPLKLGEYAGRLVQINRNEWAAGLWATFISNCFQWIILGVFGILGFQFMVSYLNIINISELYVVNVLLLLVTILLIYFFKKRHLGFTFLLRMIPGKYSKLIGEYDIRKFKPETVDIIKVLVFGALRCLTYTIQLVLLLKFFGTNLNVFLLIWGVFTIYLFQLLLPFLNWLGLIGRTGIAIFVLKSIGVNEMITGISTFVLWGINMVLPSILGLYFIFQYRSLKKENNEKEIMGH